MSGPFGSQIPPPDSEGMNTAKGISGMVTNVIHVKRELDDPNYNTLGDKTSTAKSAFAAAAPSAPFSVGSPGKATNFNKRHGSPKSGGGDFFGGRNNAISAAPFGAKSDNSLQRE